MIESEYDYLESDMEVSDALNDDTFNGNYNTNSKSEYVESKSINNVAAENEEQYETTTQNNNEDMGFQFIIGKFMFGQQKFSFC